MSKRDRVKEITERRDRETDSKSFSAATSRISQMFTAYVHEGFDVLAKEESSHELYKYIPVALVATVQSYFKGMIAELINYEDNERYRENARLLKNVSLNVDEALAIGIKTITVGDFIAHNISLNYIEDIYTAMSTLVGADFRKQIVKLSKKIDKPLSKKHHTILNDMFLKRHIICHEYATNLEVTNHNAFEYLTETYTLILNADTLVTELELDRIIPARDDRFEET